MSQAPVAVSIGSQQDGTDSPPVSAGWRRLRLAGVLMASLQCTGLIIWSYHRWTRFALASDFAYYAQAWQRIGTGHLDAYSSVYPYNYPSYGHPFIRGHFELVIWILSLVHPLWSSPFFLLVVQSVGLSAIVLVTYLWGVDILSVNWPRLRWPQIAAAALFLGATVANPYLYETASFDFHLEDLAAVFLLLGAWSLWKGHELRGVILGAAALIFGGPAALYVMGLGIACAIALPRRRGGIVLAALGLVWLLVVGLFNLDVESHVGTHYGYLIGRPNAPDDLSAFTLAFGLLLHPGNAMHVFRLRFHQVYKIVGSGGLLGLLSPFGIIMAVFVLVPDALNLDPGFISDKASFQSITCVPFLLVGTLLLIAWLGRRFGTVAVLVAAVLAVAQVGYVSGTVLSGFGAQFPEIDSGSAAVLSSALRQTPASAEVIASIGIMGRFGARRFVYPFSYATQIFPLHNREVVFVLQDDPGRGTYIADAIGAQLIRRSPHVAVFVWRPPAGLRNVTVASMPGGPRPG